MGTSRGGGGTDSEVEERRKLYFFDITKFNSERVFLFILRYNLFVGL